MRYNLVAGNHNYQFEINFLEMSPPANMSSLDTPDLDLRLLEVMAKFIDDYMEGGIPWFSYLTF